MKKFIAYMSLALVVYLAIYAIMLLSLRTQSADVSEFCDQLETGMSVSEVQAKATHQQLILHPPTHVAHPGQVLRPPCPSV